MSASNGDGVIRIGTKGRKKFAIGDEGDPRDLPVFELEVVSVMREWFAIDETFRVDSPDDDTLRVIPPERMPEYHETARAFVTSLIFPPAPAPTSGTAAPPAPEREPPITIAEALDFLARLREQYNDLADFFRPRSRKERASPDTSEAELQFSEEGKED